MIFGSVVAAVIAACAVLYFVRYHGSSSWPVADGQIEGAEIRRIRVGGGHSYYAIVTYSFAAGGQRVESTWNSPYKRSEADVQDYLAREWPRGKRVFVRFNPKKPATNFPEVDSFTYTDDRPTALNLE